MVRNRSVYTLVVLLLSGTASAQQTVLLDFSTPGCAPCRAMDPVVARLQQEGWPVRKVSTATEPGVAQQFRVDRFPTFVLISQGREVQRAVGLQSYETLRAWLAQASAPRPQAPPAERPATVNPMTFAQPAAASGDAFNVGRDLGPVPEVEIPGQPRQEAPPVAPTGSVAATPPPSTAGPNPAKLLNASVRLRVKDAGGSSFGTGTIIDARQGEALVLTCGHLFREDSGKAGLTPTIEVELFRANAGGVQVVERVAGHVISFDLDRDVALVTVRPRGTPEVARVASPMSAATIGAPVWSVGCDRGDDPTVRSSRVTTVDRYQKPPSLTATGAPVVGRSGGGLFNAAGEVVGVCFGAYEPDNEGFYAKLSSIHAELDKLGLGDIYRGGAASMAVASTQTMQPPQPTLLNEENRASPGMIAVETPAASPVFRGQDTFPTGSLPPLNDRERAAIEELSRRAVDSEVVCVIRPKQPGGKSEVITLDRVSPEFLQALGAMRGGASPRR